MTRELWPHQTRAIDLLWEAMADGHRRPMLMMPTGSGKTDTALEIVRRARAKNRRVVFTVPAIELIDQTVERFGSGGINDIGVIQAQHPLTDFERPVQIASVQTLSRRKLPETDLVIVDEAHRAHKIIFQWMQANEKLPFIGLSATPWTKGLGKYYDHLIVGATTRELIRNGTLSDFRVFAPSHPDLTGVRTVAGDFHEEDLADVMDRPQLTADVVSTWLKIGENRPTLCFAVNRAHARSLEQQFASAGVACAYVDGNTPRDERKDIARQFETGQVRVVVNVGVLTTGVDWDVRCLILARPTKSEMLFVQIIGRGLRRAVGKQDCLILDHSDSTLNLGFVTDIHHEKLDDGKARQSSGKAKERPTPVPKECPKCARLKPVGVRKCASCGFEPQPQSTIETAQGELSHLGGKTIRADMETKRKWYAMLLWYQEDRQKKHGWAAHQYRDKFGVWPNGIHVAPTRPDVEVGNWIRSRAIAWARGQEKKRKAESAHAA